MAEVLRAAAQLSATWSDPKLHAVLASGDVYRAYDTLPLASSVDTLGSMSHAQRVVFGTPLLHGKVELPSNDAALSLQPTVGIRTGAVERNQLLAQTLNRILAHLPERWNRQQWAFFDPEHGPSVFVWVDNVYIAARSEEAAANMIADIGEALTTQGMFLKPASLMIMTCGRRGGFTQGQVALPNRAGRGPTGQELALKRVDELPVLGFCLQMDGRCRQELDFHLRRADRAWFSLRRLATTKWVPALARQRLLAQRVWALALPPGAGAWTLDKADVQALRQWELAKICLIHRRRHPRSCPDVGAAYRRLEGLAAQTARAAGTVRLADAYFGAVYDRAAAWADNRNCCQQLWRWACTAGDELGWQAISPAFQRIDPRNRRAWRHAAPGRPRLSWAVLVSTLSEGSWTIAAGGTLPTRSEFIARGRSWASLPALLPQEIPPPDEQTTRPAARPPQTISLETLPAQCDLVQLFTDARGLADAARGQATAPPTALASLRGALSTLCRLRVEGEAVWALAEPICWIPRALNAAADFLAGIDLPEGLSAWGAESTPQPAMYRIAFSDGASSDVAQGWAAFTAVRTEASWTITSVRAWRGPPGVKTVPALEAAGIEAAANLLFPCTTTPLASANIPAEDVGQAQILLRECWPPTWPGRV